MDIYYASRGSVRMGGMSLDEPRNAAVIAYSQALTLARERRAALEHGTPDRHAAVIAVGVEGYRDLVYPVLALAFPEIYPAEVPEPPAGLASVRRPARYQGKHRASR